MSVRFTYVAAGVKFVLSYYVNSIHYLFILLLMDIWVVAWYPLYSLLVNKSWRTCLPFSNEVEARRLRVTSESQSETV